MSALADRFYRLEVHSSVHGISVEESTTLRPLLDLLARSLDAPPRVLSNDGGRVRLAGTTAEGDDVRIVLSHYQRVPPIGDGLIDDGWAALDKLPLSFDETT
jgi:hypothetical protein